MSRNDSTGSFLTFLVGIGVGAAAVMLLGSKRIDELRDEVSEVLNDGLDQVRSKTKDMRRQAKKTVNAAQQKMQERSTLVARRTAMPRGRNNTVTSTVTSHSSSGPFRLA